MAKRRKIDYVCKMCGYVGPSRMYRTGYRYDEVYFWAACFYLSIAYSIFIIIGPLIYSIHKYKTKYEACDSCRSRGLVPAHSKEGREIIENFEDQYASIKAVCSMQVGFERQKDPNC